MPLKNKILIVIGGSIVLLIAFIFLIYPLITNTEPAIPPVEDINPIVSPNQLIPKSPDSTSNTANGTDVIDPVSNEGLSMNEASQRSEVERLSRFFVERFGSYSNFSNFENIMSLNTLMTNSMKDYAQVIMASNLDVGSEYFGITTRIIGIKIDQFNAESTARVLITVQEQKQIGLNGEIETLLKDGRIDLVYREGKWLVNGLFYN